MKLLKDIEHHRLSKDYNINPLKYWLFEYDVRIDFLCLQIGVSKITIYSYIRYGDYYVSKRVLRGISKYTGISIKVLRLWKSPFKNSIDEIKRSFYYKKIMRCIEYKNLTMGDL